MIERIGLTHRWSDAVVIDNLVFVAGHTAEETRGKSLAEQTEEVLAALDDTLVRSGTTKQKLASVQIFLKDISKIAEMNAVWDCWVAEEAAPARATVEAKLASPDLAIEITAVASR